MKRLIFKEILFHKFFEPKFVITKKYKNIKYYNMLGQILINFNEKKKYKNMHIKKLTYNLLKFSQFNFIRTF